MITRAQVATPKVLQHEALDHNFLKPTNSILSYDDQGSILSNSDIKKYFEKLRAKKEAEARSSLNEEDSAKDEQDEELMEMEAHLSELEEAVRENKETNNQIWDSVRRLRESFMKLDQVINKSDRFQEQAELKISLMEIEEMLLAQGILAPSSLFKQDNYSSIVEILSNEWEAVPIESLSASHPETDSDGAPLEPIEEKLIIDALDELCQIANLKNDEILPPKGTRLYIDATWESIFGNGSDPNNIAHLNLHSLEAASRIGNPLQPKGEAYLTSFHQFANESLQIVAENLGNLSEEWRSLANLALTRIWPLRQKVLKEALLCNLETAPEELNPEFQNLFYETLGKTPRSFSQEELRKARHLNAAEMTRNLFWKRVSTGEKLTREEIEAFSAHSEELTEHLKSAEAPLSSLEQQLIELSCLEDIDWLKAAVGSARDLVKNAVVFRNRNDPLRGAFINSIRETYKFKGELLFRKRMESSMISAIQPDVVLGTIDQPICLYVLGPNEEGNELEGSAQPGLRRKLAEREKLIRKFYPNAMVLSISYPSMLPEDGKDLSSKSLSSVDPQRVTEVLSPIFKKMEALEKIQAFLGGLIQCLEESPEKYQTDLIQQALGVSQLWKDSSLTISSQHQFRICVSLAVLVEKLEASAPQLFIRLNEGFGDLRKMVENQIKELSEFRESRLKGKRIGLELIPSSPEREEELSRANGSWTESFEFLNYSYLQRPNFYTWKSWEEYLRNKMTRQNLDFSGAKLQRGSFSSWFNGLTANPANLRPAYSLPFSWSWEKLELRTTPEIRNQGLIELQREIIEHRIGAPNPLELAQLSLENLKFELKRLEDPEKVVDFLIGLSVLDKVGEEHLQKARGNVVDLAEEEKAKIWLNRSPEDIRTLEMELADAWKPTNHYARFFMTYSEKSKRLNMLKIIKNHQLQKFFEKVKSGEIGLETFKSIQEQIEDKYLEALKEVDKVIHDPKDYHEPGEVQSKRMIPQPDEGFLSSFTSSQVRETRDLRRIRVESESNLVKLRIIAKKKRGVSLSPQESEYLSEWKQRLSKGELEPLVPESPTELSSDLMVERDNEILSQLTLLGANKVLVSVALSDFLVELNLLFSSSIVPQAEYKVLADAVARRWGMPSIPEESTLSNQAKLYADKVEQIAFEESLYLGETDRKYIKEMYNVARFKGDLDKLWKEADNQSLENFLETASNQLLATKTMLKCKFHLKEFKLEFLFKAKRDPKP